MAIRALSALPHTNRLPWAARPSLLALTYSQDDLSNTKAPRIFHCILESQVETPRLWKPCLGC